MYHRNRRSSGERSNWALWCLSVTTESSFNIQRLLYMWIAQFVLTEQNCPKVSAICHDCKASANLQCCCWCCKFSYKRDHWYLGNIWLDSYLEISPSSLPIWEAGEWIKHLKIRFELFPALLKEMMTLGDVPLRNWSWILWWQVQEKCQSCLRAAPVVLCSTVPCYCCCCIPVLDELGSSITMHD